MSEIAIFRYLFRDRPLSHIEQPPLAYAERFRLSSLVCSCRNTRRCSLSRSEQTQSVRPASLRLLLEWRPSQPDRDGSAVVLALDGIFLAAQIETEDLVVEIQHGNDGL